MAGGQGGKRDDLGGLGDGGVVHVLRERPESSTRILQP